MFRLFSRPLDPGEPRAAFGNLRTRLMDAKKALAVCEDVELDLSAGKVMAAYARGDLCVGAFHGPVLAGYCWLAFGPVPHLDGVSVAFHPEAVWTYKSFVRPAYRGQGIAGALYRTADDACVERGRRFSLICVESHNRPSIRAAWWAGYQEAGYAAYLRRERKLHTWSTSPAKQARVDFKLA